MLGLVFTLLECTFVVDLTASTFFTKRTTDRALFDHLRLHTHDVHLRHEIGMHGFSPLSPPPHPPGCFLPHLCEICGRMEKDLRYSTSHAVPFLYVQYGIFIRPASNYRLQLFFLPQIPNGFSIEPISIWEESQLRQILLSHDAFGHLTDQPTD